MRVRCFIIRSYRSYPVTGRTARRRDDATSDQITPAFPHKSQKSDASFSATCPPSLSVSIIKCALDFTCALEESAARTANRSNVDGDNETLPFISTLIRSSRLRFELSARHVVLQTVARRLDEQARDA